MKPRMWAGAESVDGLDETVRAIGDHARTVNLARAMRLSDALDLAGGGQLDDGRRRAAVELAHQLVGSAGTFGFAGASDLAARLELFFGEAAFDTPQLALANDQVSALLEQLAAEPRY